MSRNTQHALDDCLIRLDQGESLEECLRHYPRQAEELEPLLRLSVAMRGAYEPGEPASEWLSQTRGAFLGRAVRLSKSHTGQHPASIAARIASWARRMTQSPSSVQVGLAIALVACFLGWSKLASARSLPGDPLYGVKRASEQVRVLLTTDSEELGALERSIEDRRVTEVKQVVEQKREAQVEFGGFVEKVDGGTVTIEGIAVQLGTEILRERAPAVGAKVRVLALTQPSGVVVARALSVDKPAPLPTPEPETPTQSASESESRPTAPSGSAQPTTVETIALTATPVPSPVELVGPTVAAPATPTPVPTWKWMPLPTFGPPLTPGPTATEPAASRNLRVRLSGRIDSISGGSWVVAGQSVRVASSTRIRQDKASAQVGSTAIVYATRGVGNRLVAYDIVIVSGPEKPKSVSLSGIIEAIGGASWLISGQAVLISKATAIVGTPALGALAHVQAEQYADQSLMALSISIAKGSEQVVRFSGAIQSLGAIRWSVGGRQVNIGAGTAVIGTPELGAMAAVDAVVRGDGSLLARQISVQASDEPGPVGDLPVTATAVPPTRAPATMSPTPLAPTRAVTFAPTAQGTQTLVGTPILSATCTRTAAPVGPTYSPTPQNSATSTTQPSAAASATPLPGASPSPGGASATSAPTNVPTPAPLVAPPTPTAKPATATPAPATPNPPTAVPTDVGSGAS